MRRDECMADIRVWHFGSCTKLFVLLCLPMMNHFQAFSESLALTVTIFISVWMSLVCNTVTQFHNSQASEKNRMWIVRLRTSSKRNDNAIL